MSQDYIVDMKISNPTQSIIVLILMAAVAGGCQSEEQSIACTKSVAAEVMSSVKFCRTEECAINHSVKMIDDVVECGGCIGECFKPIQYQIRMCSSDALCVASTIKKTHACPSACGAR